MMNVVDLLIEQSSIRERRKTIDDVLGVLDDEIMRYNNLIADQITDVDSKMTVFGLLAGFTYTVRKRVEGLRGC